MSKIYSIEELRKEFLAEREKNGNSEYMQRQQETIETLVKENALLRSQLTHTQKEFVEFMEDDIVNSQLAVLYSHSQKRELDINEVKKLDILIKNQQILKNRPKQKQDSEVESYSEADLVKIANSDENI